MPLHLAVTNPFRLQSHHEQTTRSQTQANSSHEKIFATMKPDQTIVIGGGAAGMMAAGRAASRGIPVLLLEKMGQCGRKIGISGKGRGNITNSCGPEDFLRHFGKNGRFLRQCLASFGNVELMQFFNQLGVEVVTERGGRVFPQSGKALDIVHALNNWLGQQGVAVRKNQQVTSLLVENGAVCGVVSTTRTFPCASVILATGGKSYPRTGSTGDGYQLAAALGHQITPLRPALVPLVCSDPRIRKLAGLELRNVAVRVMIDGKRRAQEFGELAFTEFGLSGPVILTLSGMIVDSLQRNSRIEVLLDLKPALDESKLEARLRRDLQTRGGEPLPTLLRGLLPQPLVAACLEFCELPSTLDTRSFPASLRRRIVHWLKNFRIEINDHRPIDEAIITAGGVSLKEVEPRTMASRLVQGLYFAGEILDLQADTGGFNLQAAFSTGWLAGNSIPLPHGGAGQD
jgi:predicted Rossmann fold flavoprotein